MNEQTLNNWAEHLLDTGKRNNLVNFRSTKLSSLEVLSPSFGELFRKALHGCVLEVFDPKSDEDEEEALAVEDGEERPKLLSKFEYATAFEKKLKKSNILLYNPENKPLRALKNLNKKARLAIEETGVNILYLAFGFINWTEKRDRDTVMLAPLLLVPVSIENKSALEPFRLRIIEDGMLLNPTFSFKLQNEYGLTLPEFNEDEEIEDYLDSVGELVAKLDWCVTNEVRLGIFSFQKINMYRDINDNRDIILANPNVCAILGDTTAQINNTPSVPVSTDTELHSVVDADSSQGEAILLAKSGRSFVLQGPPGTGKSQTITNIIAEFLADGKSVLFVSEKLAALNVVYEKLRRAGLEEFCLELHSHKANKKQFIEELCRTLKAQRSVLSDKAHTELETKKKTEASLRGYFEELHAVRPTINLSLYQMYGAYSSCRDAQSLDFVIPDIRSKGEDHLRLATSALEKYVSFVPTIGKDYRKSVWYGFTSYDITYEELIQFKSDIQATARLASTLIGIGKSIGKNSGILFSTFAEADNYYRYFSLVENGKYITPALLMPSRAYEARRTAEKMRPLAAEIIKIRSGIEASYRAGIYKLDARSLQRKLRDRWANSIHRMFDSEYNDLIDKLRDSSKGDGKITYEIAVEAMERLALYQLKLAQFSDIASSVELMFGSGYAGVDTDFDALIGELSEVLSISSSGIDTERLTSIYLDAFFDDQSSLSSISSAFEDAFSKANSAHTRVVTHFNKDECDLGAMTLSELEEKCRICAEHFDEIDNFRGFAALKGELAELGLDVFVDLAIENDIDYKTLPSVYKKIFFMQWIDYTVHESRTISSLTRIPHDDAVECFREKDVLNFEINKALIRSLVSSKRPDLDNVSTDMSILLREGEKKRKQKGIRQLIGEIGDLVLTLKPCFLMSPLSVSTFLSGTTEFDVVIFDEASQIFPEDAIGAIFRGSQVIIAGDSKQLPPTNFFASTTNNHDGDYDISEDDENADEIISDSVLEESASVLPNRMLSWHYRSKHEGLIAFSNREIYKNSLITFPNTANDVPDMGVEYVYVEDGRYDRGGRKNNVREAEECVRLVFEHIDTHPDRSLGIIAFSESQQSTIENAIIDYRERNPSYEWFFDESRDEPFFVKNLENVQGDERDTIIFSICYGKDKNDTMYMNFGPVGHNGGERRLNVAITRAKCNVKLVGSIMPSDIDIKRASSEGARMLRAYIEYAIRGTAALKPIEENEESGAEDIFCNMIADVIESHGYKIERRVGCSDYKIDIAVLNPERNGEYIAGIECDGLSYVRAKTARDRDHLRRSVLKKMGWNMYRVWSTEWSRDPSREEQALLDFIRSACEGRTPDRASLSYDNTETETVSKETIAAEAAESSENFSAGNPYGFDYYKEADWRAAPRRNTNNPLARTADIILHIVGEEQPIHIEMLYKRMGPAFAEGRATESVRTAIDRALNERLKDRVSLDGEHFLRLLPLTPPSPRIPKEYETPRPFEYIHTEEVASAMAAVINNSFGITEDELASECARLFGYERKGPKIKAKTDAAIKYLSDNGIIRIIDGKIQYTGGKK